MLWWARRHAAVQLLASHGRHWLGGCGCRRSPWASPGQTARLRRCGSQLVGVSDDVEDDSVGGGGVQGEADYLVLGAPGRPPTRNVRPIREGFAGWGPLRNRTVDLLLTMHAGFVRWRRVGSDYRRSEEYRCPGTSRYVGLCLRPLSLGLSLASGVSYPKVEPPNTIVSMIEYLTVGTGQVVDEPVMSFIY
jgi:hypothetical protein